MPDTINRRVLLHSVMLLGAVAFNARPGHASDDDDDHGQRRKKRGADDDDDDEVDLRSGNASLQATLRNVRAHYNGRIVEVEIERKKGRRVYEIKLLDDKGRLFEIYADAATGEILKVERD